MRRRVTRHPCKLAPSFGHQRFTDGGAKNTRVGVFLTLGPLYCRAVIGKWWQPFQPMYFFCSFAP